MTESAGGKDREGAVGSPILRAVAVSTLRPRVVSPGAPGGFAVVSRTTGRCGGGGGGFCACRDPTPRTISATVTAAIRRVRRRLATHAHQMLTSYSRISGPNISNIDTASGGVSRAARNAEMTIA